MKFVHFFQSTDGTSQGMLIWAAVVAVFSSVRTLLALIAPMTETKFDDQLLGWLTKIYNFGAKITDHEPLKPEKKDVV
jgi:hypothetical protein